MAGPNRRNPDWAMGSTSWLIIAAVFAVLVVPAAWWTTDVLEADNDFCNSCHLPSGTPLHKEIREGYDVRPPSSLAARHGGLVLPDRPDTPNFRCIDCHGGVGPLGRARIKLLSAKDTFLYLTGRFEDPEKMSWPLWDADCRQCHENFREKGEGFDGEAFHDMPQHNVDLGVDCVECHAVHDAETDPDLWFLNTDAVIARCAQCHIEYADEPDPGRVTKTR
jgi:nitrate/TMAO reductase-like tetraheme cytochrome c subunit